MSKMAIVALIGSALLVMAEYDPLQENGTEVSTPLSPAQVEAIPTVVIPVVSVPLVATTNLCEGLNKEVEIKSEYTVGDFRTRIHPALAVGRLEKRYLTERAADPYLREAATIAALRRYMSAMESAIRRRANLTEN